MFFSSCFFLLAWLLIIHLAVFFLLLTLLSLIDTVHLERQHFRSSLVHVHVIVSLRLSMYTGITTIIIVSYLHVFTVELKNLVLTLPYNHWHMQVWKHLSSSSVLKVHVTEASNVNMLFFYREKFHLKTSRELPKNLVKI